MAARSARSSGRYGNQPRSSATSASSGRRLRAARRRRPWRQRPVDALGDVVRCGAPGTGVDSDRRRDVPRGNAELAVRVAKGLVHFSPLPRSTSSEVTSCHSRLAGEDRHPGHSDEYSAGAGDGERELRAAACGEPAGEQAAERRPAQKREHVEARRLPAQVLGCGELQRRERARSPEQIAAAGQEEQNADRGRGSSVERAQARARRSRGLRRGGGECAPCRASRERARRRGRRRRRPTPSGRTRPRRRRACLRQAAAGARRS